MWLQGYGLFRVSALRESQGVDGGSFGDGRRVAPSTMLPNGVKHEHFIDI